MRVSRRAVLLGGAATLAGLPLAPPRPAGGLVGQRASSAVGEPAGTVPRVRPGRVLTGRFVSRARLGRTLGWVVAEPPAGPGDGRRGRHPVCLFLHGVDSSARALTTIGYDRFLASAVGAGMPPFTLAAVDGGNTCWHRRADGDDPPAMLVTEFLPLLARLGVLSPAAPIGLLGYSMGGYGCFRLAAELGPDRVAAIAVVSPSLWLRFADTPRGAFDGAPDYARNDVFALAGSLDGVRIRIDCGATDQYAPAVRAFVERLGALPGTAVIADFGNGGHTMDFWRARAPAMISFLGSGLNAGNVRVRTRGWPYP